MPKSFIKMWTDALDDEWFVSLNMTERGLFLTILLLCKRGADSGHISGKNVSQLSAMIGTDRRTLTKFLEKCQPLGKITLEHGDGYCVLRVTKYKEWQRVRASGTDKSTGDIPENSGKDASPNPKKVPKSRADNIREDKSRAEHTSGGKDPPTKTANPDHKAAIEFWCQQYEDKFGLAYNFTGGKDGAAIKAMLKTFGLETLRDLMTRFLDWDDDWIKNHGGYTISQLRSQVNKVAQRIGQPQGMKVMSDQTRRNLITGMEWAKASREISNAGK